jgi:hypothetical protein
LQGSQNANSSEQWPVEARIKAHLKATNDELQSLEHRNCKVLAALKVI